MKRNLIELNFFCWREWIDEINCWLASFIKDWKSFNYGVKGYMFPFQSNHFLNLLPFNFNFFLYSINLSFLHLVGLCFFALFGCDGCGQPLTHSTNNTTQSKEGINQQIQIKDLIEKKIEEIKRNWKDKLN